MQAPYLVSPITLLTLGCYLCTALLVKTGIMQRVTHRKIWNSLLLISFVVAGILGILLAIRVNYKLDWPWMESLLKWHVDAGILMSIVATLHLVWHLSYYLNIFKRHNPKGASEDAAILAGRSMDDKPVAARGILPEALALGFFTMVVQVLLIREITTVFQGNELMMGWTLAIWMVLTGLGSWLGRSFAKGSPGDLIHRMFLIMAFLPPLTVVAMDLGRNIFFLPGILVHPLWFITAMLFLLAPLCLLSGYSFALLVNARGAGHDRFAGVYTVETAGSLAGGVVVSFLLIRLFSIMESLLITSFLVAAMQWAIRKDIPAIISTLFLLAATLLFLLFPLELKMKSFLFENQKVLASHETPFGNITICENGDEKTVFVNGSALYTTGDAIVNEEFVHYAMLQHPSPRKVLLISGELAGMSAEILKYPGVGQLDYVEINPGLTKLISIFKAVPPDHRIRIIPGDARRFVQRTGETWDVVIVAVPDPSSLQLNRYFTSGFLSLLRKKLNQGAVVLYGISPAGNYISPGKTNLGAALYQTLAADFRHVLIIPGERDYFVASDDSLTARIGTLTGLRGISGSYVNGNYIDDASMVERGEYLRSRIAGVQVTNTDQKPLPVFYHTLQYLSRFGGGNVYLLLLPLLLLLLSFRSMHPVAAGMFITGFTASSAEILLIFWFQVVFGNLYAALGLIFALFMGGLALGSFAGNRLQTGKRHFLTGQLLLAAAMLVLPILWKSQIMNLSPLLLWVLFIPAVVLPSFLTGFQFVTSTRNLPAGTTTAAASVYAADLWGSALGALVITTILVPLAGVSGSCLIMAALNLLALAINLKTKQS